MRSYSEKISEQLQELIGSTAKTSIYHYTSVNGLKSILENKTLWLSEISFMNDESEIKYTFNLVCYYLDSVKKYSTEFKNSIKKWLDILVNTYSKEVKYGYYVMSFSLNSDSLPIWTYYTKNPNSAGFNVEFDKDNIIEVVKNHSMMFGCIHGLVLYNKTRQKKAIKKVLDKYYEIYLKSPDEEALNAPKNASILEAVNDLLLLSLFFKSSYFKNEEEYRIVIRTLQFKEKQFININFRISNGILTPFLEVSFKDKPEIIKGVTISPTQKSPLVERGLSDFLIAKKYKDVNISKSKIPLRY